MTLFAVILLGVLVVMRTNLARPIKELLTGAAALGEGDLNYRVIVPGRWNEFSLSTGWRIGWANSVRPLSRRRKSDWRWNSNCCRPNGWLRWDGWPRASRRRWARRAMSSRAASNYCANARIRRAKKSNAICQSSIINHQADVHCPHRAGTAESGESVQ